MHIEGRRVSTTGAATGIAAAAATGLHGARAATRWSPGIALAATALAGGLGYMAGAGADAALGAIQTRASTHEGVATAAAIAGGGALAVAGIAAKRPPSLLQLAALGGGLVAVAGGINLAEKRVSDVATHGESGSGLVMGLAGGAALVGLGLLGRSILKSGIMQREGATIASRVADLAPKGLSPLEIAEAVKLGSVETVTGSARSAVAREDMRSVAKIFVDGAVPASAISKVMGGEAQTPVRIYVPYLKDVGKQQELLRSEIAALGAMQKKTIFVVNPAAGYPFKAPTQSMEFLTHGDVATIVVPYGTKPIQKQLHTYPRGVSRLESTLATIREEIAKLPEGERPRVVLFGESYGAGVASSVVGGRGATGMRKLGVDRMVLEGTPRFADGPRAAAMREAPLQGPGSIREIRRIEQVRGADPADITMISHEDDLMSEALPWRLWQAGSKTGPNGSGTAPARWLPISGWANDLGDLATRLREPGFGHSYTRETPELMRHVMGMESTVDEAQLQNIERYVYAADAIRSKQSTSDAAAVAADALASTTA